MNFLPPIFFTRMLLSLVFCFFQLSAMALNVLFFVRQENQHHSAEASVIPSFTMLSLSQRGISVTYTTELTDLNYDNLSKYDALLLYGNALEIKRKQEKSLIRYVEKGGGLVAIHSASGMFKNSELYGHLIGGRFKGHGAGVFTPTFIGSDHPAMQNVKPFTCWDETYRHKDLTQDILVLMHRPVMGPKDSKPEPWTWVREQGKGRVWYTASGHDIATWSQTGFASLLEAGIVWAVGDVKGEIWRKENYLSIKNIAEKHSDLLDQVSPKMIRLRERNSEN